MLKISKIAKHTTLTTCGCGHSFDVDCGILARVL